MSDVAGGVFIAYVEPPQQCDFCGKIVELRPYGPNGEPVCFACAMKDEESAKRQFLRLLEGSEQ